MGVFRTYEKMGAQLLSIKLKRGEKVFIEIDNKRVEVVVAGYKNAAYQVLFVAPKEIRIIRENAKKQSLNIKEGNQ